MKKWFALLILFTALTLPFTLSAQECIVGNVKGIVPLDHEELTITNSALGFTAGTIQQSAGNAAVAVITVEDDAIRFWMDGTTPTSSSGHLAAADTGFTICGLNSIKNFLAIRVTTDAALKISYFKGR